MKKIKIHGVISNSIAQEVGIAPGDYLVSINKQEIKDIFDYRYLVADEEVLLEIEDSFGELIEYEIEKEEYEDLGLEFENDLIEEANSCSNHCVFCFIDQLPKGMRKTLYFKDDDSRLSFLTGNYVTLTNVSDEELDRIIRYKMSPINISVHSLDPEIRVKLLGNKNAKNIYSRIEKLTEAGIEVNCQIVLCKGLNDKEDLDNTISKLTNLYPNIKSISVVPVGLTNFREKLFKLEAFSKDSSIEVINQIEKIQSDLLKKYGSRIVYLADEFYIMAQKDLPTYEFYEDFPQIENGVGLISSFKHEFFEFLNSIKENFTNKKVISIATGVLAYNTIKELSQEIEKNFDNIRINVYEIKNNFFGDTVTVTGLLTGRDIIEQLSEVELGERLLLSKSMFKANTDLFLDDYKLKDVKEKLSVDVDKVENTGEDFINKILF